MLREKALITKVYLSQASLNTTIVTAKSSEMNVLLPGGADGDYVRSIMCMHADMIGRAPAAGAVQDGLRSEDKEAGHDHQRGGWMMMLH
jgi:hypothetical protein